MGSDGDFFSQCWCYMEQPQGKAKPAVVSGVALNKPLSCLLCIYVLAWICGKPAEKQCPNSTENTKKLCHIFNFQVPSKTNRCKYFKYLISAWLLFIGIYGYALYSVYTEEKSAHNRERTTEVIKLDEPHKKIVGTIIPIPKTCICLFRSLALCMPTPALQSSLKGKMRASELNKGISTHHFSSALNAQLLAIQQPLTDLFTAQNGLCLAVHCTSKCSSHALALSFCTLSISLVLTSSKMQHNHPISLLQV